jgi:hypothetical protein
MNQGQDIICIRKGIVSHLTEMSEQQTTAGVPRKHSDVYTPSKKEK